jgi:hypothetical protein
VVPLVMALMSGNKDVRYFAVRCAEMLGAEVEAAKRILLSNGLLPLVAMARSSNETFVPHALGALSAIAQHPLCAATVASADVLPLAKALSTGGSLRIRPIAQALESALQAAVGKPVPDELRAVAANAAAVTAQIQKAVQAPSRWRSLASAVSGSAAPAVAAAGAAVPVAGAGAKPVLVPRLPLGVSFKTVVGAAAAAGGMATGSDSGAAASPASLSPAAAASMRVGAPPSLPRGSGLRPPRPESPPKLPPTPALGPAPPSPRAAGQSPQSAVRGSLGVLRTGSDGDGQSAVMAQLLAAGGGGVSMGPGSDSARRDSGVTVAPVSPASLFGNRCLVFDLIVTVGAAAATYAAHRLCARCGRQARWSDTDCPSSAGASRAGRAHCRTAACCRWRQEGAMGRPQVERCRFRGLVSVVVFFLRKGEVCEGCKFC